MKKYAQKISLILIFFILNNINYGQNFTDLVRLGEPGLGSDARSLGMGNAFVGVADNFSAMLSNPAGLAQIKEGSFSLGVRNNTILDSTLFMNDYRTKSSNKFTFGQLGVVAPYPVYRGSLVFAFGYSSQKTLQHEYEFEGFNRNSSQIRYLTDFNDDIPYYLGLSHPVYDQNDNYRYDDTPIEGNLTQSGKLTDDGHLYSWSGAFAWEAAKNLYVGATISYKSGWYISDRHYYEDDWDNIYDHTVLTDPADSNTADFMTFYFNDVVDQSYSGWDAKFGLLYNMDDFIKIGATLKLPTRYTVDEKYSIYGESIFGNGTVYSYEPERYVSRYYVKTPYEFSAGASVNLFWLLISGQVSYIDYTSMKFTSGFSSDELLQKNLQIKDMLREVVNANVGAELELPFMHSTARAGLIYQQSPYKGDDFNHDRKFITLGGSIGVNTPFQLDVTYAYGWWRDFNDNYGNGQSRVSNYIDSHTVLVTTKFTF